MWKLVTFDLTRWQCPTYIVEAWHYFPVEGRC